MPLLHHHCQLLLVSPLLRGGVSQDGPLPVGRDLLPPGEGLHERGAVHQTLSPLPTFLSLDLVGLAGAFHCLEAGVGLVHGVDSTSKW